MSATSLPSLPAFQLLGQPVDLAKIEKELQGLFLDEDSPEQSGIARASLINLTLYNENSDDLEADASVLAELTSEAACRSLLISADPHNVELSAQAFIQVHCLIDRNGKKTVCTEQISFYLTGNSPGLLRNIVFSNLDSDLPLAFWWRGEFSDAFEDRLYSRIDRLIFDSENWENPRNHFVRLLSAQEGTNRPFVMHDLAFTRMNSIRQAVASAFDRPSIAGALGSLDTISIRYADGYKMSALFLTAWVSSRLKADVDSSQSGPNRFVFHSHQRGMPTEFAISIEPIAEDRKGTIEVDFELNGASIEVSRCQTRDFLRTLIHREGCPTEENWLPAKETTEASLVADVLNRAGRNRTYTTILPKTQELLAL